MLRRLSYIAAFATVLLAPAYSFAADAEVSQGQFVANNVWMMVATGLVFIMHLGFAALESALCQAKNTVNILPKAFIDVGWARTKPNEWCDRVSALTR